MGIWIKELPQVYYKHCSFFENDVMLWQNKNVYVMDNHRDAAWCWLQQCEDNEHYNFMHIDQHYDMGDYYYDEDLKPVVENPRMSYEEMMNMERSDKQCKTLRWDNYIRYVYELRPEWFNTNLFITQKEGDICSGWNRKEMELSEKDEMYLIAWLDQYLIEDPKYLYDMKEGTSDLKWILNLDIDFFFYHFGDIRIQLFSDDYIREVAKMLREGMNRIKVMTIAISPDCLCGNGMKEKWDNGFRVLRIMAEEIEALHDFPFPEG